jgi:glycosyltransferase involved in cell wall biosynthesis
MDPAFPRTHSIAAIRLCAGLASQGQNVELVVPAVRRPSPPASELFAAYGLEPNFELRYLPVGRGSGDYDSRTFRRLLIRHALEAVRRDRPDVVISDGIRLVLPYVVATHAGAHRPVTAPWMHEFRNTRLERLVCANATCVLATNEEILRDMARSGVSSPRTFVTGNPVPRERIDFGRAHPKAEARKRLGLVTERPVIAYTGKLYTGMRELGYLVEAATRLPDALFVLTGGQPAVIDRLDADLRDAGVTNVRLAGMLPNPEEIRFYQQAADVLVTYYSRDDLPFAAHYIPSKLAEYMTTGNTIVAADYPAVRDLLHSGNAILVKPDDPTALTEALRLAASDRAPASSLGRQAQRDIASRSSETIASDLVSFLTSLTGQR